MIKRKLLSFILAFLFVFASFLITFLDLETTSVTYPYVETTTDLSKTTPTSVSEGITV